MFETLQTHCCALLDCCQRYEVLDVVNSQKLFQENGGIFESEFLKQLAKTSLVVTINMRLEGQSLQTLALQRRTFMEEGHQSFFEAGRGRADPLLYLRKTRKRGELLAVGEAIAERVPLGSALVLCLQALRVEITTIVCREGSEALVG
jgi:hypothetical protein